MKLYQWALRLQDNVQAGLNKISGAADHTSQRFSNLQDRMNKTSSGLGSLKNLAIGALAGISVAAIGNQALQAFDEQEKANAQLRAAITSTKGIAGKTFEELDKQASELQRKTLFGDETIMGAQAMMITFTNVRKDIYDQTIPAVLDLATAMKTDPTSAAMQLGKALNDPIKGLSMLGRSGIQFSESQVKLIENYTKTNQLAKAQAMILKEVNTQFGGSAKAAADAGLGPLVRMKNAMGDVMEKLGGMIARVFLKLLPYFYKFIDLLDSAMNWLISNMKMIIEVLSAVYMGVKVALAIFSPLLVMIGLIEIAVIAQNLAWMLNPLFWIPAAIVIVVASFTLLWNKMENFRGWLMGFGAAVKQIFVGIGDLAAEVFGGLADMLEGAQSFNPVKIYDGFNKLKDGIKNYGKEIGSAYSESYVQGMVEVRLKNKAQEKLETKAGSTVMVPPGTSAGAEGATPSTDAQLEKGNTGISEGTKNIRNITVNIKKLADITIQTSDMKTSSRDIQKLIEEALVRAVGSSEIALSNGG